METQTWRAGCCLREGLTARPPRLHAQRHPDRRLSQARLPPRCSGGSFYSSPCLSWPATPCGQWAFSLQTYFSFPTCAAVKVFSAEDSAQDPGQPLPAFIGATSFGLDIGLHMCPCSLRQCRSLPSSWCAGSPGLCSGGQSGGPHPQRAAGPPRRVLGQHYSWSPEGSCPKPGGRKGVQPLMALAPGRAVVGRSPG